MISLTVDSPHNILLLDLSIFPDDVSSGQLPRPLVRDPGNGHLHHPLVLPDQVLQLTGRHLETV